MKRIEVGCDQNSLQSETAILFYSKPKSEHGRLQLSVGQISLSRLSDSETVNQACTHIDGRNFKIIGCIEMHTGVQTFSLRELPISSCPRPRQQWQTVTNSDSDSQLQVERHCEALWASWLISWIFKFRFQAAGNLPVKSLIFCIGYLPTNQPLTGLSDYQQVSLHLEPWYPQNSYDFMYDFTILFIDEFISEFTCCEM